MNIIARQKGNRRWDLPREFPLVDSQGLLVMCDRRKLADRRKNIGDIDNLMAILSRLSTEHTS
jgi:predicted nucleic acid-binding protein